MVVFSTVVSVLALCLSGLVAWLTLFRRGTLEMTQPTVIYFGPDASRAAKAPNLKVYLRTLLYATAQRGCVVEGMFLLLQRGHTLQTFNVWVYGEERLSRGSGLFISQTGLTMNHHFLLPFDERAFEFLAGSYTLQLCASVIGEKANRVLTTIPLTVSAEDAEDLKIPEQGLYFDWSPDVAEYRAHVRHVSTTKDQQLRSLFP